MEKIVKIKIEKLPEGLYLATSDEIQGLVAQGRTISETIEIARDVAKKLIESHSGNNDSIDKQIEIEGTLEYPLVIGL
jgi:predicted RNase H-like HicB family nuclease